jgi:cytochrome c551/c552
VGPDARNDSLTIRGPKGYDEINQARESGFFGWPMFIADNKAYQRYDYGTGTSGEAFNPDNPRNLSPNNTGIEELPSPQPAFIWYPYDVSEEFPQVETGGRNAMAGPVYYTDLYPQETRLPEYFDGKLFIYEWVRRWIKVVSLQPNGDFDKMDPFMADTDFNAPIDMEVGPDGRIYILEYGSGWFSQNDDSGLARIDFNSGNRAPVVEQIAVDKTSGTLPLEITATVDAYDPEQDQLSYKWNLGDGTTIDTDEPNVEHTFGEIGEYAITVEINDGQGHAVTSAPVFVYAGNEAPEIFIEIEGNNTFYFPGQPVTYSIRVEDEGETLSDDKLTNLFVSAIYVGEEEVTEATEGHLEVSDMLSGRGLIDSYNCQACHGVSTESIGPSYTAVSERYQDSTDIDSYLIDRIINGSSGVWGDRAMPAHTNLTEADAQRIVSWIMSLNDEQEARASLPGSGQIQPTLDKEPIADGVLVISASYTDDGSANTKPLTGNATVSLRNNSLGLDSASNLNGYSSLTFGGNFILMAPQDEGSFRLGNFDLSGISAIQIMTVTQQQTEEEYQFELRMGGPDGVKIGEAVRSNAGQQTEQGVYISPLTISIDNEATDGGEDLYLVSRPLEDEAASQIILSGIIFQNE